MSKIIHSYKNINVEQLKESSEVEGFKIPALYVDMTNICKKTNRRINDYISRNDAQDYFAVLCREENLKQEDLIIGVFIQSEGRKVIWGHPKVAIDLCCWISADLRYWACSTILLVLQGEFVPITQRAVDTKKALEFELDKLGYVTRDRNILEHNCEHLLDGLKLIHYQYSTLLMLVDAYLKSNPDSHLNVLIDNVKSANLVSGFKLRESFVPDLQENPEREYPWMDDYKQHNSKKMLEEMIEYERKTRINTQVQKAVESNLKKSNKGKSKSEYRQINTEYLNAHETASNWHPLGWEQ